VKVALVHNLRFGGAHRRVAEQVRTLGIPVQEVVLEGAESVTPDAVVVPFHYRDADGPMWTRPVTRHLDLAALLAGYRHMHGVLRALRPDVVWLNPCRYIQTPWLSRDLAGISAYYCDEPRRSDYDLDARASTRRLTRLPYLPLRSAARWADRSTARSAAAVATNSSFSVDRIRTAYGRDAVVIPCGVSERFSPPPGPSPRDHLLSVGSLIPSKGHDLAVRAASASGLGLPVTVVAPRGDRDEETRLRSIAHDAGVPLVIRTGVTDAELVSLYRSAAITLYLARGEPFGLASIESQACGTPVIVSDDGGLPETLVNGCTGWAVPRRLDVVADRISQLGHRSAADAFGGNAAAAAGRWSWSGSSERLCDLFETVGRS